MKYIIKKLEFQPRATTSAIFVTAELADDGFYSELSIVLPYNEERWRHLHINQVLDLDLR